MQVARRTPTRSATVMRYLRHLGGPGLFFLAVMDSTPIPTLGGVDILLAVLAARHVEPWWFYALVATAGSLVGAYITFHAAHKGGAEYLQRKFGPTTVNKFLGLFERWGTAGLVASRIHIQLVLDHVEVPPRLAVLGTHGPAIVQKRQKREFIELVGALSPFVISLFVPALACRIRLAGFFPEFILYGVNLPPYSRFDGPVGDRRGLYRFDFLGGTPCADRHDCHQRQRHILDS